MRCRACPRSAGFNSVPTGEGDIGTARLGSAPRVGMGRAARPPPPAPRYQVLVCPRASDSPGLRSDPDGGSPTPPQDSSPSAWPAEMSSSLRIAGRRSVRPSPLRAACLATRGGGGGGGGGGEVLDRFRHALIRWAGCRRFPRTVTADVGLSTPAEISRARRGCRDHARTHAPSLTLLPFEPGKARRRHSSTRARATRPVEVETGAGRQRVVIH